MANSSESRPSVLDSVSETQLQELERQFTEGQGDHQYWQDLTSSYGWSEQDSQAVYSWFGQKMPSSGSSQDNTGTSNSSQPMSGGGSKS